MRYGSSDSIKKTYTHEEYKDLSENVRHYNNHFFALLTLLSAGTAGLFQVLFSKEQMVLNVDKRYVVGIGLIVTGVFWFQGAIYLRRQKFFEARLVELENGLGFDQYKKLIESDPEEFPSWLRPGRCAWNIFFLSILSMWVYAGVKIGQSRPTISHPSSHQIRAQKQLQSRYRTVGGNQKGPKTIRKLMRSK
jgi:hypothetical protein